MYDAIGRNEPLSRRLFSIDNEQSGDTLNCRVILVV